MESDNLRTASLYINNQLLSRGLLRDGQTIDFARPEKGDGGVSGTMARVMGVINDLILRRDRDASQRETLTQTLLTLRSDSLRHNTELERLNSKHADAQRKIGVADAAERALKQQLRSAEQAARGLKEEMARMKILVGQTRAQCANEVRKRERVIEGLKRHVAEGGRARGSGKVVGVVSVNVVVGVGAGDNMAMVGAGGQVGTDDTGYDLRMETNEFLTELARGLSEENENLGGLVRRTVETLRTLSGCEKESEQHDNGMVVVTENAYESVASEMETVIEHLRHLLTNPSFVPLEEVEVREEEIVRLREGWERMEARWREAVQMMDGWRKRMARSGQTVNLEELKMGLLLSPLKPKEEDSGNGHHLSTLLEEGDLTQADIDAMDDSGIIPQAEPDSDDDEMDDSASSLFEDEPLEEGGSEEVSEDQQEQNRTLDTVSSLSPGPPPQLSPLKETLNGNRGPVLISDKAFTTIIEENTYDLLQLNTSSPQGEKSTPRSQHMPSTTHPARSTIPLDSDSISLPKLSHLKSTAETPSPQKPTNAPFPTPKLQPPTQSSKLPRPREPTLPPQSPLTMASIAAKLAATEREADAARVRAKLKAARGRRTTMATTNVSGDGAIKEVDAGVESKAGTAMLPPPKPSRRDEEVKGGGGKILDGGGDGDANGARDGAEDRDRELQKFVEGSEGRARKRKAAASGRLQGGRASRRRSTLSPWELESLIMGGGGGLMDK